MDSWSVEEKRTLLSTLRERGSVDIVELKTRLPGKTELEIRNFCGSHYFKATQRRPALESQAYIKQWLRVLKTLRNARQPPKQLDDVLPRVLKYAALFEKNSRRDVDLAECYKQLHRLSQGLPGDRLDETTDRFLFNCLSRLAKELKATYLQPYKNYMGSLNGSTSLSQSRSTLDNPLQVPKDLLRYCSNGATGK